MIHFFITHDSTVFVSKPNLFLWYFSVSNVFILAALYTERRLSVVSSKLSCVELKGPTLKMFICQYNEYQKPASENLSKYVPCVPTAAKTRALPKYVALVI